MSSKYSIELKTRVDIVAGCREDAEIIVREFIEHERIKEDSYTEIKEIGHQIISKATITKVTHEDTTRGM